VVGFESLNQNVLHGRRLSFVNNGNPVELSTTDALRDAASEAGCLTQEISLEELSWDPRDDHFYDYDGVRQAFFYNTCDLFTQVSSASGLKLLTADHGRLREDLWTLLLDLPDLLSVLQELFPHHPFLNPAVHIGMQEDGIDREQMFRRYSVRRIRPLAKYQRSATSLTIMVWLVNGYPVGIGIEETMGGQRRFVPHLIAA
jgi:glutathionylspermidine synthase